MQAVVAVRTVLVVDDNAGNRALAKATLDDEGIDVRLASSGAEGLALFEQTPSDCVLLDIRMPGLDGVAVCERLRALPGGNLVAILFLTAHRDVETFDRALRAGGDDFITKPFSPAELVVRIETAMRLRQMAAERGQLAIELKQQRDELQRLQLHKEQLTAFLVHDFKNPVNAIELNVQRVLRNPAADARSRDAVSRIQQETRGLMRMITNLLDIGKADEGQLAPARVPLDAAVQVAAAVHELRDAAEAAGLTLVADVAAGQVSADPDLLHRVLANLIENAIRFSPEGTTVRVSSRATDHGLELSVADAGAGIPAELCARVFDRFVMLETGANRTNRGLGLAFCKVAVEAHGGAIWVEDGSPGARFCFRIPEPS